ncbi:hypothetical protein MNBD_GAMMA05-1547 [hydrothermal vent metagenome]|uniref:Flagellar protein FlaG n=1 Tax=hydrothermal vent metagenome TaxID=652676 RepID=A0A3B0XC54_9ZZZZ
MVTINTQDVFTSNFSQKESANKVNPSQRVSTLPERGKEFPDENAKNEKELGNIDEAVESLNNNAQVIRRELQFTIDKESGYTVIKVLDATTDEVIRQLPSEEAIKVAQRLREGKSLEIFNSFT